MIRNWNLLPFTWSLWRDKEGPLWNNGRNIETAKVASVKND